MGSRPENQAVISLHVYLDPNTGAILELEGNKCAAQAVRDLGPKTKDANSFPLPCPAFSSSPG